MKGYAIVVALVTGLLMSCSESSEPTPAVEEVKNTQFAATIQGGWVQIVDEKKESYNQINLIFDGDVLHWKDSTVNNGGKYAVIRTGSTDVLYLKNEPAMVNKYLMGRPPLTPGAQNILVSEWRGNSSVNRNYRNVNQTDGWELINEWETSNAQPPIPDAVYALFEQANAAVTLEYDGQSEDYLGTFSRMR